MRRMFLVLVILIANLPVVGLQRSALAQVVERREGDANPSAVIFHATLYGAGTGLLLGGAYALVQTNDNVTTWDCLKWGFAGGVGGGFLVGVIWALARPEPKGSTGDAGKDTGQLRFGPRLPEVIPGRMPLMARHGPRAPLGELRLTLVTARF